jgi:lysozyme
MQRHMTRIAAWCCLPFVVACTAGQVGNDADTSDTDSELRQCAQGSTLTGIDVSYYQGKVDWSTVASSGRSFAIVRLGDGWFRDPSFDTNWQAVANVGLYRGLYQFFRASQDPMEQAQMVIDAIGQLGPMDLPPAIDIETLDGERASTVVANAQKWIDAVTNALGRAPLVYIGQGFADQLGEPASLGTNPLWVANWQVSCPRMPSAWDGWQLWQTKVGTAAGVHGQVDLDVFNGTESDLAAFAGPAL